MYVPSGSDKSSLSLSSCNRSSSLEAAEMKSSSESMVLETFVSGVGGAASGAAEAKIFLLLRASSRGKAIVASAALRFRVVGGMVGVVGGLVGDLDEHLEGGWRGAEASGRPIRKARMRPLLISEATFTF